MSAKRKLVLILSGVSTLVWIAALVALLAALSTLGTGVLSLSDSTLANASADTVGGWNTIFNLIGVQFGGIAWVVLAVFALLVGLFALLALVMWICSFALRRKHIAFRVTATIGQAPVLLAGLCLLSEDTWAMALALLLYFGLEMVLLYTDASGRAE
ncbi:MAG: hypothetical protein LUG65_05435 [Clostridiales bacterium]|nr:hypothetical protein [Clostridiales bacterium]